MRRSIKLTVFFSFVCCMAMGQVKKTKEKSRFYPVVIQFHSICCGVPSDKPLAVFLSGFKKENQILKITADKISPMGKEGEYYLAFTMKEMNRKQKFLFKNKIKKIAAKMKDKGNVTVEENMNIFKSELPANVKFSKVVW